MNSFDGNLREYKIRRPQLHGHNQEIPSSTQSTNPRQHPVDTTRNIEISYSEDLAKEEKARDDVRQIRAMAVNMNEKKRLFLNIKQEMEILHLKGMDQQNKLKFLEQLKSKLKESNDKIELWRDSLNRIEGNFGTGVAAYFLFIKWLMFLNLGIFVLLFCFVVLPSVILEIPETESCDNLESTSTECCSETYMNTSNSNSRSILNIIQGTGAMEHTVFFYGVYTNQIFGYQPALLHNVTGVTLSIYYDLPLAYVSITVVYLILSLGAVVKTAVKCYKEELHFGKNLVYKYCNFVFGGWDFCIKNTKMATIKHKAIYIEMKASLDAAYFESRKKRPVKNFIIRSLTHLIVLCILVGSATGIYYAFSYSQSKLGFQMYAVNIGQPDVNIFFLQFLPSITIVLLNMSVPILFKYVVRFEHYSPVVIVRVTLLRTVFLRLASLGILLARLHFVVNQSTETDCYDSDYPQCWETFVGQQFYKLFITDFALQIIVTFCINFPRSLLVKGSKNKFTKMIGEQEFELPAHVLDVVYTQTLCWLGSLYCPFLPAMTAIYCFFIFYIKKFDCLVNSKPSEVIYRASRSNSIFMIVLLLSFVVAVIPTGYVITELVPSRSCGPFRGLQTMWVTTTLAFLKLPYFIHEIILFLATGWFFILCFIVLVLLSYYYSAMSTANEHLVHVLRKQLIIAGRDKTFLQQEYEKNIIRRNGRRETDTNELILVN